MKKIDEKEYKSILYKILLEIDAFCKKNNIRYSLTGGTLLGAIRHDGFIPWDDDIDIVMMRNDYEIFLSKYPINDNFGLIHCNNSKEYSNTFAKLYFKKTVIKEPFSKSSCNIGIYIDIFPIDYCGNTIGEAKKIYDSILFKKYLLVASNWKKFEFSQTRSLKYEVIRILFFLVSRMVLNRNELARDIDAVYKKQRDSSMKYVANFSSPYNKKDIFQKVIFEKYKLVSFEGGYFMSICDYNLYLRQIYGDYMKMPPENKRKSHHLIEAYWKE